MKTIKNFLLSFILLAVPLAATAQNFKSFDFLNGATSIFLTNNAAVNYGDASVPLTNALGFTVYSQTNLYSTNGIITPGTLATNANTYYGPAWVDVPIVSDRNGNVSTEALSVAWNGTTAKATNTVTLVFSKLIRVTNGTNPPIVLPATQTADKWTLLFSGTQAQGGICTNMPSGMLQGAWGIRLTSATLSDASGAAGLNILNMSLQTFVP